jgi:DNA-binding LacI/PurR family transcriptional regulator
MAVSLKDIADRAGVTGAAVSMALRGNPRIGAARRREIKDIAAEMGYKPNFLARGLSGGSTHSMGIVMSGLVEGAPPATINIARTLMVDIFNHGYMGSIADSMGGDDTVKKVLEDFIGRRFNGVVYQSGTYEPVKEAIVSLLKEFISVVVITNKKEPLPFDQIVHSREPAIKTIAEYLAKRGRKLPIIAGLYGPKAEIYRHQFRQYGIKIRPEAIIEELPGKCDIFYNVLEQRLGGGKLPFDVVVCNNDATAIAAISWLRSKNLNVPKDVSVIGFDNQEGSKYLLPPLATVDRQSEAVAKLASQMLFERADKPDLPPRCQIVSMHFVHRESAG